MYNQHINFYFFILFAVSIKVMNLRVKPNKERSTKSKL